MVLTPAFEKDTQKREVNLIKQEEPIEKPIIPSQDRCCTEVCKYIDDSIANSHKMINYMRKEYGNAAAERRHAYIGLGYTISYLKAFKEHLNKQDICKCE